MGKHVLRTRTGYVTVRNTSNGSTGISRKYKKQNLGSWTVTSRAKTPPKHDSTNKKKKISKSLLSSSLQQDEFITTVRKQWANAEPFSNTVVDFVPYPFKIGTVHQLISRSGFLEELHTELLSVSFHRHASDLYSFEQTDDLLKGGDNGPAVHSFLKLLKGPLLSWIKAITGKELTGKITVTGSKYGYTDHLLCHDDNLSDRSIAFVLYLCKDWEKSDGGALQLFKCTSDGEPQEVVHSIFPAFGSFVFFEVNHRSFHHVQEIMTENKVRLSINGWFHGSDLPAKSKFLQQIPIFQPPIEPKHIAFQNYLRPCWFNQKNQTEIKKTFCKELSVNLPNFLKDNMFNQLEKKLKEPGIVWEKHGPAYHTSYERAKPSTLPKLVQDFLSLLQSKNMFRFLSRVTVDIDPDSATTPGWNLEVQRWSPGDYMVLVDNDVSSELTGIDFHFFFNVEQKREGDGGILYYMGPDRDSNGFLEENARLSPEKNSVFLVARIAGMRCVTKYIDHCQNLQFYKIVGTYSQG